MNSPIMAFGVWASNAELIEDCSKLGYLKKEWRTLDPTHGYGTFWRQWRPNELVACDLELSKSPVGYSVDFTNLPWADRSFDSVVLDPPYKLNGVPATPSYDESYGTSRYVRWQDRMGLILSGIAECSRVLGSGCLLLKCQDQVCGAKVRWQTDEFTTHAGVCGLEKIDRFDFLSYRPQPPGTRQLHARRNASTLLVFRRKNTNRRTL